MLELLLYEKIRNFKEAKEDHTYKKRWIVDGHVAERVHKALVDIHGGLSEHDLISENEIIELIITDQMMPNMKGDEFLKRVHGVLPDTMKILLTGHAGLDSAIKAINEGGLNRYIEKPWNAEAMRDDIKGLIGKFRQNLENQYLLNNLEARIRELGQA